MNFKKLKGKVKKKNRKYLLEWIDENVLSEYMNSEFISLLDGIENGKAIN